MKIALESVERVADGIWRGTLSQEDACFLRGNPSTLGDVSVLLVLQAIHYDEPSRRIEFDPSAAQLLTRGTSDTLIVVQGAALSRLSAKTTIAPEQLPFVPTPPPTEVIKDTTPPADAPGSAVATTPGDQRFVQSCPSHLRPLGEALVAGVRAHLKGELTERSGRLFVETPRNIWAVRIQPVKAALKITVGIEVNDPAGLPRQVIDGTAVALRELGLDEDVRTE